MNETFEHILDECIIRLRSGESLEACLQRYPADRQALEPLLRTYRSVQAAPRPMARPEAVAAGRSRMQAALANKAALAQAEAKPGTSTATAAVSFPIFSRYSQRIQSLRDRLTQRESFDMKLALRASLVVLLLLVLIGTPAALAASENSLPGERLYPVKRSWEQVRLSLTLDAKARQQLQTQLAEERRQEVQNLLGSHELDDHHQVSVEFSGELQSIQVQSWVVSGFQISLPDSALIEGDPVVGALVEVHAQFQPNGTLVATHIEVHNSGDDPLLASDDTATPEASHTPEASETPQPTMHETEEPEHTQSVEDTEEPEHTEEAEHTQEPEHTVEPEDTEEPEHIDQPERTEEPEHTEEPEDTPEPEQTEESDHHSEETQQPATQPTEAEHHSEHDGH